MPRPRPKYVTERAVELGLSPGQLLHVCACMIANCTLCCMHVDHCCVHTHVHTSTHPLSPALSLRTTALGMSLAGPSFVRARLLLRCACYMCARIQPSRNHSPHSHACSLTHTRSCHACRDGQRGRRRVHSSPAMVKQGHHNEDATKL